MTPTQLFSRRLPWLAIACALFVPAGLEAGPDKGPGHRSFPKVRLGKSHRGKAAVDALGGDLPGVARAYGLRSTELYGLLLQDRELTVDQGGRLHYADPAPEAAALPVTATPDPVVVLAETFTLHSRPGASRTIYLDFNGHLLSGTAWNSSYNAGADIAAPPFDTDGDPATFGDAERAVIQQVWLRVAEDFAPFDVDVTTELTSEDQMTRSGALDDTFGVRVLVSPISQYFGSYGGFAYVGSFDDVGDTYKPALIFPEMLGNSAKYIAEACAHETGHTLGLNHDGSLASAYYSGQGSGETGWAPIMGVGYYQNVTQWSKGEYSGAMNLQDDLAVMGTYGLSVRADDHGNTAGTATFLAPGAQLFAEGVIEGESDVDVFAFTTGAGAVSINFGVTGSGPNLDLAVELRDGNGALIASSNPAAELGASLTSDLAAGTYYLHVRGTGAGDPAVTGYSSYASLGQYALAGSVVDPAGSVAPIALVTVSSGTTTTSTSSKSKTATATTTTTFTFSGSGSFDQDGSIMSYFWTFSDGSTASGVSVKKGFATPGTYAATLTVTDNSGLTASASATVTVSAVNLAPKAVAVASTTTGVAPLAITFDGAGSADPDGTIVSYKWSFGDGTTATGATVTKTYSKSGTYAAKLTVTDNKGATGTASLSIKVSPAPNTVVRVSGISLATASSLLTSTVQGTVTVTDLNGAPVSGVKVSGSWSGLISGTVSATTDSAGVARVSSKSITLAGTAKFRLTGLSKPGFTYSSADNVVASASISVTP